MPFIPESIDELLKHLNLNGAKLAKILGVSRTSIIRYRASQNTPNVELIDKLYELAREYEVKVEFYQPPGKTKKVNPVLARKHKVDIESHQPSEVKEEELDFDLSELLEDQKIVFWAGKKTDYRKGGPSAARSKHGLEIVAIGNIDPLYEMQKGVAKASDIKGPTESLSPEYMKKVLFPLVLVAMRVHAKGKMKYVCRPHAKPVKVLHGRKSAIAQEVEISGRIEEEDITLLDTIDLFNKYFPSSLQALDEIKNRAERAAQRLEYMDVPLRTSNRIDFELTIAREFFIQHYLKA